MNKIKDFWNLRYVSLTVVLVGLAFVLGFNTGIKNSAEAYSKKFNTENRIVDGVDLSSFWKVWDLIDEKYPNAKEISDEARVYGAISGLVGSLGDPYTQFFKPDEKKIFEEEIAGSFSGVGMEIGIKNRILTVIAPLRGTPAYRAGLLPGDKILKIDSTETYDLGIDEAVKLIRGEKGTTVTLLVLGKDDEDPREIKVVREKIEIPTLETEQRADGIFVIKLFSFSENSANLFRGAMKKFVDSNSDKLLIDLRGNPGGYLEAAVDMASWFLPAGKAVVIEDYGGKEKENAYRSYGYDIFSDALKLVILIDGGSASSAEILAGALHDHNKAILVGETSFGKGSVQEVVDVTEDTILKVTIAKWLTPKGTSISEKGLTPEYKVELTKEDLEKEKDPQMDKAVEILLNWQNYRGSAQ